MHIEKRKDKIGIKYYLVHSYRDKDKVRKIRKYLGKDLIKRELSENKIKAEKHILELIDKVSTHVFMFKLTKKQVEQLNKYNDKIEIFHLDKKDWQKFTEEFVYNTNAIEGSTIGRNEVPGILNKKDVHVNEEIETKGVAKAVNFINNTKEDFSVDLINKLHKLCFEGSKSFAGKLRNTEVVIKDPNGNIIHMGVPSSQVNSALNDMINWYKENKDKFKPLVLAAILHNQFEYIHPFQDGNGRVGRLLLNFILLKNGYPPINIKLENRLEYYKTLEDYSKGQDIKPTLRFLIKQYKKTLRKVITKNRK